MKVSIQALIGLFILLSISSFFAEDIRNITAHEGVAFSFNCCMKASNAIKSYIIYHPSRKIYPIFKGAVYENGRIMASVSDKCGVSITNATLEDNGIWKCDLFFHDDNRNSSSVVQRSINVVLSEPLKEERISTLQIVFALIAGICCFVACTTLIVICWYMRCNSFMHNETINENETNNKTILSNHNYSDVELVYFKELKERIERRKNAQEEDNAQDDKITEELSKAPNEHDSFNTKRKVKKEEEATVSKENKLGLTIQFSSKI